MIVGPGWHETRTEQVVEGERIFETTFKGLPAEEHPHPLIAAADAPPCCLEVAEHRADGENDSEQIQAAARGAEKLYLSPGTFTDNARQA